MPKPLFDSIVAKVATRVPLFAKHIVTQALARVGAKPHDVTPQQMLQAIEQELEPQIRRFLRRPIDLELMGGGILLADRNDHIQVFSPGARRLLGVSRRRPLCDPALFRELVEMKAIIPAARWTQRSDEFVFHEIPAPGAKDSRINLACGPFRNEHGEVVGVSTFIQDITLRHAVQQEMARTQANLSAQVESRTHELERLTVELEKKSAELEKTNLQLTRISSYLAEQRDKLSDLNQELQNLDNLKSQLLFDVSHELRTPMVSVKGYTDLLLDGALGGLNAKQRKGLRVAQRNIDRLVHLVDELLDYSRLTARSTAITKKMVDIRPLISDSVELLRPEARKEKIALDLHLEPRPMMVYGDANRIAQVLVNLVGNAIKFNRPGGRVNIETNWDQKRRQYVITVSDTGVGIPENELKNVFDRFFRGKPRSGAQRPRGIGLGLAICKTIVDLHGGRIWAERGTSTSAATTGPTVGTRFHVALPAHPPDDQPELPLAEFHAPNEPSSAPTRTPADSHILVVDDEPDVLEYIRLVLDAAGYKSLQASDGADALEILKTHPNIDLVLLDVAMTGLSGLEVLDRIRAQPYDAKVCMISAHVGARVEQSSKEKGADGFLPKPFAPDRLLETVSALVAPKSIPE
jgi:signal transduction histidine kinase/ActR/RegA family two-component response regulator